MTKRRDVFCGVPTPEEPHTPLATLLRSLLAELQAAAGRPSPLRSSVLRAMTRRRVEALTKERMWGGFGGGYGGGFGGFGGLGGGGDGFGGGFGGGGGLGGLGGGGGLAFGGDVSTGGHGQRRGVTFGQVSHGGGGGGGGYRDLDAVAKEVEEQTAEEVAQLGRLRELQAIHRDYPSWPRKSN